MCGFAGFYIKRNKFTAEKLAEQASLALRSRGTQISSRIGRSNAFVYARLPTDDIFNESLGIIPAEENFFLYNGILYNLEELVSEFNLSECLQSSDTATLQSGFMLYGKKFLSRCRGMFAFACIYNNEIVLARDTIGIKPLYYVYENDVFAFASEIKALTPLSPKRIYEVEPGQIIKYDIINHKLTKERFRYIQDSKYHGTEQLESRLLESLILPTQRYLSQSPNLKIGLMLSGGLDSSVLLTLLHKHLKPKEFRRVTAFCVSLNDAHDHIYAKRIAKRYKIKLIVIMPDSEKISVKKLDSIVRQTESPYARVAKVALLQDVVAARMQAMGIHVAISGEGADEIFYGYRKFIDGKSSIEIQKIYDKFFKKIFYRSLLQRLDRVFARRQIEARVPFLDQAIVELAGKIPANKKVAYAGNRLITKKTLREFAQFINVPKYIVEREKTTMTQGATSQANSEDPDGYLELYFQRNYRNSFSLAVQKAYMQHYSSGDLDILTGKKNFNLRNYELRLNK